MIYVKYQLPKNTCKLNLLNEISAKAGLNVNIQKTKVMAFNKRPPRIELDQEEIEVDTYTYLRSLLLLLL